MPRNAAHSWTTGNLPPWLTQFHLNDCGSPSGFWLLVFKRLDCIFPAINWHDGVCVCVLETGCSVFHCFYWIRVKGFRPIMVNSSGNISFHLLELGWSSRARLLGRFTTAVVPLWLRFVCVCVSHCSLLVSFLRRAAGIASSFLHYVARWHLSADR